MVTGMEAVLVTLTGQVVDPIPVDITLPAWTCPGCRQVVCIPLRDDTDGAHVDGSTTLDDVLDMADHRCPE